MIKIVVVALFSAYSVLAMDYGENDRQSANVEDRRPAGAGAARCKAAHSRLEIACIEKMDEVAVSAEDLGTGYQHGVAGGLMNLSRARSTLEEQRKICFETFVQTKDICEQAMSEAEAIPGASYERDQIERTADNVKITYGAGTRKYEKSYSAINNAQVQLQKIGSATGR